MSLPDVVSRADWLAARKELLVREKQATRARSPQIRYHDQYDE